METFFGVLIVLAIVGHIGTSVEGNCHSNHKQGKDSGPGEILRKITSNRHRDEHKLRFLSKFAGLKAGSANSESNSSAPVNSGANKGTDDGFAQIIKWDKAPSSANTPKNQQHLPEENIDIRGDLGSSPGYPERLRISKDGEISFSRSLNFDRVRNFHDEDQIEIDHNEHMDEDHDHFHKIRNVRETALPVKSDSSSPQQLSTNLGNMQGEGAQTLNNIGASNSATANDFLALQASGLLVDASHSANSAATGTGAVTASGYTTVNTVSNGPGPGWKSP